MQHPLVPATSDTSRRQLFIAKLLVPRVDSRPGFVYQKTCSGVMSRPMLRYARDVTRNIGRQRVSHCSWRNPPPLTSDHALLTHLLPRCWPLEVLGVDGVITCQLISVLRRLVLCLSLLCVSHQLLCWSRGIPSALMLPVMSPCRVVWPVPVLLVIVAVSLQYDQPPPRRPEAANIHAVLLLHPSTRPPHHHHSATNHAITSD